MLHRTTGATQIKEVISFDQEDNYNTALCPEAVKIPKMEVYFKNFVLANLSRRKKRMQFGAFLECTQKMGTFGTAQNVLACHQKTSTKNNVMLSNITHTTQPHYFNIVKSATQFHSTSSTDT